MTVSIIGAGKLGQTLIKYFASIGKLNWVLIRNSNTHQILSEYLDSNIKIYSDYNFINENIDISDITILAVPDSDISDVSQILASKFQSKLAGKAFIHCSGQLSVDSLINLSKYQAKVAACHPFQTFYFSEIQNLKDVPWGIECQSEDYNLFEEFIKSTGGIPIKLDSKINKSLYHAAAVAASNFTSATLTLSKKLALEANIDPQVFLPIIIKTTIENFLKSISNNNEFTLTGPYIRGDNNTIDNHLKALEATPALKKAYELFNQALEEINKSFK